MQAELLARFQDLTPAEVDALPFGAIVVALDGTVLRYNQHEARLAHLDAARVVGKNFFRDIAPCTDVRAFAGRMRTFVAAETRVSDPFPFSFAFAHGTVEVSITFMRLTGDASVLIAVERSEAAT